MHRRLALIGLLLVVGGCGLKFVRSESSESLSDKHQELVADTREALKAVLKAPATAQFSHERVTINPEKRQIIVSGSVDSQNSFGALLRSRYENVYLTDDKGNLAGSRRGMFYEQNGMPSPF